MLDSIKNFVKFEPSGVYDASTTAIAVGASDIAKLPTPPFNLVWWNVMDYIDAIDDPYAEIIRVTAVNSVGLTATRGQEGTAAVAHSTQGKTYRLGLAFTAKSYNDIDSTLTSLTSGDFGATTLTALAISAIGLTKYGTLSGQGISASKIHIKPEPPPATAYEGDFYYDSTEHAFVAPADFGGVNLQIGQEQWFRGFNNSGDVIPNGSAVRILGASLGRPTIRLASTANARTARVIGVATHDIPNASFGYITSFGKVNGVDTSSFVTGRALFLAGTTGELAMSPVEAPAYSPFVGVCLSADATNGIIFSNPVVQSAFTELPDVLDSMSAFDGSMPVFDQSVPVWRGSPDRGVALKPGGLTANAITSSTFTTGISAGATTAISVCAVNNNVGRLVTLRFVSGLLISAT